MNLNLGGKKSTLFGSTFGTVSSGTTITAGGGERGRARGGMEDGEEGIPLSRIGKDKRFCGDLRSAVGGGGGGSGGSMGSTVADIVEVEPVSSSFSFSFHFIVLIGVL